MTSKEAIRILELYNPFLGGDDKKILSEAIELAIEALKTHDVPDTNVGDIIYRQAAIDALDEYIEEYSSDLDENGYHNPKWCAMQEARMTIQRLPSAQPEPKWIPCSERLPEPRMDVWACSDIGQIQGYYEEHVGIWYASFGQGRDYLELYVTAWMPLPEPYQAERREK